MIDFIVQMGAMTGFLGTVASSVGIIIINYILFCMMVTGKNFYKDEIKELSSYLKGFILLAIFSVILMIIFFYIIYRMS